jgi:hypothetical protein
MFLFKASGATYRRVIKQTVHAFQQSPVQVRGDEFVLLAKNREDCGMLEKQVQFVAKLLTVRPGTEAELDGLFPGVHAGERWKYVAELYWLRPLAHSFNLGDIADFNSKRYAPVQGFAKLDDADARALLSHLQETNSALLLDFVNEAERPNSAG